MFKSIPNHFVHSGLVKAQYAAGYFTEMGLGCRRDPLEANVWYVKAADQGDERARARLAAIRAAAEGANPAFHGRNGARPRKEKKSHPQGQFRDVLFCFTSNCEDFHEDITVLILSTLDPTKQKQKRFAIF